LKYKAQEPLFVFTKLPSCTASIRFFEIATEFERLNVDVIVMAGTEPTIAVKQVTSVIPIEFKKLFRR
jgi:hypothetical protein